MAKLIIGGERPAMVLFPVIVEKAEREDLRAVNRKGEELRTALLRILSGNDVEIHDLVPGIEPLDCCLFGVNCPLDRKEAIKETVRKTAKKCGIRIGD